MRVSRFCLMVVFLLTTCHHAFTWNKGTADPPPLGQIGSDFVQGVATAAQNLQQSAIHKARAATGAVSTLTTAQSNLVRNLAQQQLDFLRSIGRGIWSRQLQLWNLISGSLASLPGLSASNAGGSSRQGKFYPVLGSRPTFLQINTVQPRSPGRRQSEELPEDDFRTAPVKKTV